MFLEDDQKNQKNPSNEKRLIACNICGKLCFGHCPHCYSTKSNSNFSKPEFKKHIAQNDLINFKNINDKYTFSKLKDFKKQESYNNYNSASSYNNLSNIVVNNNSRTLLNDVHKNIKNNSYLYGSSQKNPLPNQVYTPQEMQNNHKKSPFINNNQAFNFARGFLRENNFILDDKYDSLKSKYKVYPPYKINPFNHGIPNNNSNNQVLQSKHSQNLFISNSFNNQHSSLSNPNIIANQINKASTNVYASRHQNFNNSIPSHKNFINPINNTNLSYKKPSFIPEPLLSMEVNLSKSHINLKNLLYLPPVYYEIDTKSHIIGNYLMKKIKKNNT